MFYSGSIELEFVGRLGEADEVYDYQAAETNYLQTLQDFDAFLDLIPTS